MSSYATVHPTPRPWEADSFKTEGGHGKYDAYRLVDANGKTICDTMNGELQTEHVEYDDDIGSHAWDEQGRVDMEFAARAVNAHDDLVAALTELLDHYTQLVNCGDCGNWDPEKEGKVKAARAALAKAGAT
jgi:hypothetical protein